MRIMTNNKKRMMMVQQQQMMPTNNQTSIKNTWQNNLCTAHSMLSGVKEMASAGSSTTAAMIQTVTTNQQMIWVKERPSNMGLKLNNPCTSRGINPRIN